MTIRLRPDADPERTLEELERRGARLSRRADGSLRQLGHVVSATLDGSDLDLIAQLGAIHSIEPAHPVEIWSPTDTTAIQTGVTDLWNRGPRAHDRLLGQGQQIFSIDRGCDVFHPNLYFADGGAFAWIDNNDNQVFEPEIDQLRWSEDSRVLLTVIDAAGWYREPESETWTQEHLGGSFNLERDWLYLDQNGNGQRDFGPAAGFSEQDPAYGEPLFIPDDANLNGQLDPNERLLQLDTSKVVAIRDGEQDYLRGINLIDYPSVSSELSSHGTAVAGILVGGQNPGRRKNIGLAPHAEISLWSYAQPSDESFVDAIDWGIEQGANVHLHEWATWIGQHLDGSSHVEVAIDAASASGVAQISPAGNLARANKHTSGTIEADATSTFTLDIPADYTYLVIDIHWEPSDTDLTFTLKSPDGRVFYPTLDGEQQTPFNDLMAWSSRWNSPRQSSLAQLWLYSDTDIPIGEGTWTLSVDNPNPSPVHTDLYLTDFESGWSSGIAWEDPDPNSTLCYPTTADEALTVGAHGGRFRDGYGVDVGELRAWSSRGPRINGDKTVDLTAPDDPITAYPSEDGFGQFRQFGGTSGAGATPPQ